MREPRYYHKLSTRQLNMSVAETYENLERNKRESAERVPTDDEREEVRRGRA